AVREVVAVHHREDHVLQGELRDRRGDPARLVAVDHALGIARLYVAEAAAARADLAEDHEGRRAAAPALRDVRAARLFADRVQPRGVNGVAGLGESLAAGQRHLQPAGLRPAKARFSEGYQTLFHEAAKYIGRPFAVNEPLCRTAARGAWSGRPAM